MTLSTSSVLFLVLSVSAFASGLQCYECGTDESNECADNNATNAAVIPITECETSCVYTEAEFDDLVIKSRECGNGIAANSCSQMELGDAKATICSCDSALCNAASITMKRPEVLIFILMAIVIS